MKNVLTVAAVLVALHLCCASVFAQSDSTVLDLGRIRLNRTFTQTISVPLKDLEKLSVANLSEALSTWLFGAFSNKANLAYVVDGSQLLDVNALSLQDIQDITLVLDATSQLSGAIKQQYLIVITTKRSSQNRQGLHLSGQSAAVVADFEQQTNIDTPSSSTNFYHQYNLSAYRSYRKIRLRATANYLRDVSPEQTNGRLMGEKLTHTTAGIFLDTYDSRESIVYATTDNIPRNLDRLRLRLSLEAPVHARHTAYFSTNFAGQLAESEKVSVRPATSEMPNHKHTATGRTQDKYQSYHAAFTLQSALAEGLHNTFNTGATFTTQRDNTSELNVSYSDFFGLNYINKYDSAEYDAENIIIENHLQYKKKIGSFHFEPSLNASAHFFKWKDLNKYSQFGYDEYGTLTSHDFSAYNFRQDAQLVFITPALQIQHQNIINLQGGFTKTISEEPKSLTPSIYPFVRLSADLSSFISSNMGRIKVFSAYAKTNDFLDAVSQLPDYSADLSFPYTSNPHAPMFKPIADPGKYYTFTLGSTWALAEDQLVFNYHYDQRNWGGYFERNEFENTGAYKIKTQDNITSFTHFFSLTARKNTNHGKHPLNLLSQLNLTFIRSSFDHSHEAFPYEIFGSYDPENNPWTIGWANRLTYKRFSAGIDLLAFFNQSLSRLYNFQYKQTELHINQQYHSLAIQNAFVSYQFKKPVFGWGAEAFINSRNISLNGNTLLHENRQYVGMGFSLAL